MLKNFLFLVLNPFLPRSGSVSNYTDPQHRCQPALPVVAAVAAVAEVAYGADAVLDVALAQVNALAGVQLLRGLVGLVGG